MEEKESLTSDARPILTLVESMTVFVVVLKVLNP